MIKETYGECARVGIKSDVNLVHKIRGVTDAHQRAPGVDVILPAIELLVIFEGKVVSLVLGLEQQTIRLQIYPFDVGYILQQDHALWWGRLCDTASVGERGASTRR